MSVEKAEGYHCSNNGRSRPGLLGPLVRAFAAEIGEQRTLDIVAGVIREIWPGQSGRRPRSTARRADARGLRPIVGSLAREWARWRSTSSNNPATRLDFNVTRCRYAEMYRALGAPRIGGESLSCQAATLPWPRDSIPSSSSSEPRRSCKVPSLLRLPVSAVGVKPIRTRQTGSRSALPSTSSPASTTLRNSGVGLICELMGFQGTTFRPPIVNRQGIPSRTLHDSFWLGVSTANAWFE